MCGGTRRAVGVDMVVIVCDGVDCSVFRYVAVVVEVWWCCVIEYKIMVVVCVW